MSRYVTDAGKRLAVIERRKNFSDLMEAALWEYLDKRGPSVLREEAAKYGLNSDQH